MRCGFHLLHTHSILAQVQGITTMPPFHYLTYPQRAHARTHLHHIWTSEKHRCQKVKMSLPLLLNS